MVPDKVHDLVTGEPGLLAKTGHWGPVWTAAENAVLLIMWSLLFLSAVKDLLRRGRGRSASVPSDGATKPDDS
ncbi:hypothetical protein [Sphaerisporangium rufum]|uniref:hypothetical protein n=1 Tax=Sphaerisporangium rufum TaxID=1381558 RepID=UPI00194F2BB9|nr:hypothetical protein [Sphaerisporangium rufum]